MQDLARFDGWIRPLKVNPATRARQALTPWYVVVLRRTYMATSLFRLGWWHFQSGRQYNNEYQKTNARVSDIRPWFTFLYPVRCPHALCLCRCRRILHWMMSLRRTRRRVARPEGLDEAAVVVQPVQLRMPRSPANATCSRAPFGMALFHPIVSSVLSP